MALVQDNGCHYYDLNVTKVCIAFAQYFFGAEASGSLCVNNFFRPRLGPLCTLSAGRSQPSAIGFSSPFVSHPPILLAFLRCFARVHFLICSPVQSSE